MSDKTILTNRRIPDWYVRWCERTGSQLMTTFLLDYLRKKYYWKRIYAVYTDNTNSCALIVDRASGSDNG